jgi:O-antigen ligase
MGALLAASPGAPEPPTVLALAVPPADEGLDHLSRRAAFSLAAMVSTYTAWHWGGTERPALRFAFLITAALATMLVLRHPPSRRALISTAALSAFLLWSVVSAIHSAAPSRALPLLPVIAWYAVLSAGGAAAVRAGALRALLSGVVAGGAVQAVVGLYDRWGAGSAAARASGTFYAINQYAGFLAVVLPLTIALALTARRAMWAYGGAAALMTAGLLASGSRGGLAAAVGGAVLLLVRAPQRWHRRAAVGAGVVVAGVIVATFLSSSFVTGSSGGGSAGSVLASRAGTEAEHAEQRVSWWIGAVRIWRDEPVFGTGPGTYGYALFSHQDSQWAWSLYAHNAYAEAFAETGAPGGVLYGTAILAAVGIASIAALRRRRDALDVAVAAALVVAAAHFFIDVDGEYPALAGVLFLLAGCGCALGRPGQRAVARRLVVIPLLALLTGASLLFAGEVVVQHAVAGKDLNGLQRAAALHPGDAAPYREIALRTQQSDPDASLVAARQWVDADGVDPQAWIALAAVLDGSGRAPEALAAYRQAVAIDPVNPSLRGVVAAALARAGDVAASYQEIDAGLAIRLRPEDRKFSQLVRLADQGVELARRHGDSGRERLYSEREADLLRQGGFSR